MRIRQIWMLFLILIPLTCQGLGLGEIRLSSKLNQPLNARIELVSADRVSLEDIRAQLASSGDFLSVGLDRPYLLTKLRFKPEMTESGVKRIHITTDESVNEPYLDFLLEVRWPGGRLVREYTLLLDPPGYVALADTTGAQAHASETGGDRQAAEAGSYGPVGRSETLWVIAEKIRPTPDLTIEQTMMALQLENPGAFLNGNMNLLKTGVRLRIPDRDRIADLSPVKARETFQQQTQVWRNGLSSAERNTGSQSQSREIDPGGESPCREGDAGCSSTLLQGGKQLAIRLDNPGGEPRAEPPDQPQYQVRLRVVDTGHDWLLGEQSRPGYPVDREDKLLEAIADSEQDLAAVKEINRDITELRGALEAKIDTLRRALEEKDLAIRDLQQKLQDVELASGPELAVSDPNPQNLAQISDGERTPVQPPATEMEKEAAALPVATDPAALPVSSGIGDHWLPVMVVAVLLLAIVSFFVIRSRRSDRAFEAADSFGKFEEFDSLQAESELRHLATQVAGDLDHKDPEPVTVSHSKTGADVASLLTEADIYLAYRRYNQAESLIREALENHPKSCELKAKLLEIYAFRRDKRAFAAYLDEVYVFIAANSPQLWEKVVEMGSDLTPDHPAFLEDLEAVSTRQQLGEMEDGVSSSSVTLFAESRTPDSDADISVDELTMSEREFQQMSNGGQDSEDVFDLELDFDPEMNKRDDSDSKS